MKVLKDYLGLYTDMYQLSMMDTYLKEEKHNCIASFDYFSEKFLMKADMLYSADYRSCLKV